VLCGECGPRNVAESIRDFVDCFGLFFWAAGPKISWHPEGDHGAWTLSFAAFI
jgi:hypothetical protein